MSYKKYYGLSTQKGGYFHTINLKDAIMCKNNYECKRWLNYGEGGKAIQLDSFI